MSWKCKLFNHKWGHTSDNKLRTCVRCGRIEKRVKGNIKDFWVSVYE